MNLKVKTPISYYGGKQQMLRHILPIIPKHNLYCEPFCGGAAVYWAKTPSNVEVINDTNEELINFYRILQTRFKDLQALVKITLHSRKMFKEAWDIYNNPVRADEVKRAWAIFMIASQSFGSQLKNSWGYDRKKGGVAIKVMNKKRNFTEALHERIERTQIDCQDGLKVIKAFDCAESFFYIDPPYPGSNQGHYCGYTFDDLEILLKMLVDIKGKFLLSNYPHKIIEDYSKSNGWSQRKFKLPLSVSKKAVKPMKIEVLTANYPI
jgi:DNA adenine methylase